MRKYKEVSDPNSCMGKAGDGEMTFVLLSHDPAAPVAIRAWIAERLRLGKNEIGDGQITEAERCAAIMELEKGTWKPSPPTKQDAANA